MKRLSWKQWTAVAALVVVLLFTGLFAVRSFRRAIYWRIHRDEVIRPWMTLPYVAHSHRVPPHILYEALNLEHPPHDRRPIKQIAADQHKSVNEIIATLNQAIAGARPQPPTNGPPPTEKSP